MAKIELKGYFVSVTPAQLVGEKSTPLQKFIFKVPGYTDQFGDKKGEDEYWQIQIFGDNVKKHNLSPDLEDKKAKITIFLNSKYIVDPNKIKDDMYIINATLHEYTIFN